MNAQVQAPKNPLENGDGVMLFVHSDRIHKRAGFNPRKHYSKTKLNSMRNSVEDNGIQQPISVRPHPSLPDDYELVAGHTRYDLSVEVGRFNIPVICKKMTDQEMLEAAISENLHRADLNAIEEGQVAKELLVQHKNDRDEVLRILGWSVKKLDARVQMTYAIEEVAQALTDGTIKLGHAEALCSLRETAQKGGLKLIISQKLSVEDTLKRISTKAKELSRAIFDTADCQSCQHNSSPQSTLFESTYDKDKCLNGECFQEKSSQALVAKKVLLAEDYNTVKLDTDCAKGTYATLTSTGQCGVGSSQLEACNGCASNGAIISTVLGSEGNVTENTCFDLACNTEKVKAYKAVLIASDKPAAVKTEAEEIKSESGQPDSVTKKVAKKKSVASTVAATPKKIVALNHTVHRKAASAFVGISSQYAKAIALVSVAIDSNLSSSELGKVHESLSGLSRSSKASRAEVLERLLVLEESELDGITQGVVCLSLKSSTTGHCAPELPESDAFGYLAVSIVKDQSLSLSQQFVMNVDYLEPHTKPTIKVMLEKSLFSEFYEKANGEGAFTKLMAMKKGDLLDAIKTSDFNWVGFIPDSMKLEA